MQVRGRLCACGAGSVSLLAAVWHRYLHGTFIKPDFAVLSLPALISRALALSVLFVWDLLGQLTAPCCCGAGAVLWLTVLLLVWMWCLIMFSCDLLWPMLGCSSWGICLDWSWRWIWGFSSSGTAGAPPLSSSTSFSRFRGNKHRKGLFSLEGEELIRISVAGCKCCCTKGAMFSRILPVLQSVNSSRRGHSFFPWSHLFLEDLLALILKEKKSNTKYLKLQHYCLLMLKSCTCNCCITSLQSDCT